MTRPVRARISSVALQHNLQQARNAAPHSKIMAVIKANGYGHGLLPVARALERADAYAVARMEEALALREAGISKPIVLLEGFMDTQELMQVQQYDLEISLHCEEQLTMLEAASLNKPLRVWLKIDTGMHRLGFPEASVPRVRQRLAQLKSIEQPIAYLSHLACADERDSEYTLQQTQRFEQTLQGLDGCRSLANSAGLLAWPQTQYDWVRPGIMMYGVSPFPETTADCLGLQPVMTLQSRIIAINSLQRGDAIGYGGSWVCPENMRVGVVAVGYGDGYPRHAGMGTPVLVNGHRAPLVGRVSMDMIMIDLRGLDHVRVGDPVTLWGEGLPVEEVAAAATTIGYELLTAVTARVDMIYS